MTQDVFTALADPTRRALLEELSVGERAVGELVAAVEASQPTVSKHLRVLRESGLVHQRAVGQRRFYRIEAPVLLSTADILRGFAGEGPAVAEPDVVAAPAADPDPVLAPAVVAEPTIAPEPAPVSSPEPSPEPSPQSSDELPAEPSAPEVTLRRRAPAHRADTAAQPEAPRRLDPLSAPQEEAPARARGVGGLVSTVLRRRRR